MFVQLFYFDENKQNHRYDTKSWTFICETFLKEIEGMVQHCLDVKKSLN